MLERSSRKFRTRRSCCLSIIGTFILVLVISAGLFFYFYSHPISNQALNERVLRRLERISGLPVAYDSASLTLATGQYHITNLRFLDPAKKGSDILSVGEVFASVRPWQIFFNPESVLTRVVLKNPSPLDLEYSQDSLAFGPRTKFLVDSVRKAQPPGSGSHGSLPFEELRIEDLDLAFTEKEGILPDITTPTAVMILDGDLVVKNVRSNALDLDFSGQAQRPIHQGSAETSATLASGVTASLLLNGSGNYELKAEAQRLALTEIFREMPKTSLKTENLKITLGAKMEGANRSLKGSMEAGALSYVNPENAIRLDDRQVKMDLDLDVNTSTGLTNIRSLALNSLGAHAMVKGQAAYKKPKAYNLSVTGDNLDNDYRVLLERMLPTGWDVEAEKKSLAVNLNISGSDFGISSLNGKLAVRGVHLLTPALPAALQNLQGDVEFGADAIKLVDMTGEYAGARVALDGSFIGDVWGDKKGELNMNWSTIIPIKEMVKLHADQLAEAAGRLSGSGNISGHGTWRQQVDLSKPQSSSIPQVEGQIEFKDVGLDYDALPAPIAGLNGVTRVKDNKLVVDHLSGTMQGNRLEVMGEVTGKDFFWRDSQVSASLESQIDFAHLGPYLTPEQKENLDKYELSGRAETVIILRGPASDLASRFTGAIRVNDVSFVPRLDFMAGKFTGVTGIVTWDGNLMRLTDVTGELNGEKISLDGDITASNMDLNVQSKPQLEKVAEIFPRLGHYLQMSGAMGCDLTLHIGDRDRAATTGSIVKMLESARKIADESVKNKTFALNGELQFDGANIRHIAMPPAHKENGRSIPEARLIGLKGTVKIENDTLFVPEDSTLTCSFADTPNCRISGAIKLRHDNFPQMHVKVSSAGTLKLDSWALGWGKDLPKPDKPPITGKRFDLDAEISAPSVIFRGQQGGRSRAKLSFNMVQDESPRVTNFREVVVQGTQPGMGRVIGSGKIESYVWRPQQFPRWQTSLDVQSMPMESMLSAVFVEPANIRGMITGNLNMDGIGTDARTIHGQGSGFMTNLEIGRTAVIRQLGQTTGRNFGGMLFQTARAATFDIGNGALSSRDLALETNGLQLEMRGDYWFSGDPSRGIAPKTIDGALRLRLFKSVFGSIPIIGQMADLADEVANAFLLAFKVSGTADNPRVTPIALPLFQGGT